MADYYIERFQVEGGFLDGMDVSLKRGLNAIIGARGTGKSTFIELIRFCLGIKGHTADSHAKALGHARSVLKDGMVTITLSNGKETHTVSRAVDSENEFSMASIENISCPLIFSQTEVEAVGLLPSGRMAIIDEFVGGLAVQKEKEASYVRQVESFSQELIKLNEIINYNEERSIVLPRLNAELGELLLEEEKLAAISDEAAHKSKLINDLTNEYVARAEFIRALEEASEKNTSLRMAIHNSMREFDYNIRDEPGFGETKSQVEDLKLHAMTSLEEGLAKLIEIEGLLFNKSSEQKTLQAELTRRGQEIRKEVDNYKEGAGEVARKTQTIKNKISQLDSIRKQTEEVKSRIEEVRTKRDAALVSLEQTRNGITALRQSICDRLNSALSPKIRICLEQFSQLDKYEDALINSMKGSGIRYNDLAPALSQNIPPRTLANIVEENNIDELLSLVSITKERAIKVVDSLRDAVGLISTVKLEDEVSFEFLDGGEYKSFEQLSTGQRCTVILPIILEHQETVLVIDQPEDHIDNAFIADTLISSIRRRAGNSQIIVTTHNANIPVLGSAAHVLHLKSDGTRGYIESEGGLSEGVIVEAISKVMEGGREAFAQRAQFYG